MEYYKLFNYKYFNFNFFVNIVFIITNFIFIYYGFNLIPILVTISGIYLALIFNKYNCQVTIFPYFYLAIPFYLLIYLNNHYLDGKIIILWVLSIVSASDSSAYVFGNLIKGKKLLPRISPNKTWSGFIFSLIFSIISSSVFSFYFNLFNVNLSMLLGFIIGLSSTFGDLFESYLKRINNKKDTSKIIPGHGGLLDRLDGFLFAIVIMFFFILLWSNS